MLVALIAMVVAVLAHHLGLSEAIAKVVSKVARCPKCLTFWLVLLVLTGTYSKIRLSLSRYLYSALICLIGLGCSLCGSIKYIIRYGKD